MSTSRISSKFEVIQVEVIYTHDALSGINRKYEFDGSKLVVEISRPLSGLEVRSKEYKQDEWDKLKQQLRLGLSVNII